MNFTLDDSDPSLSYSPGGWAVQPPNDPQLDQFFDRTYHAAQQDGATLSFTFAGSGFAVYGSKGPGHAKLQVQYDTIVVNNIDTSAAQTAFGQVLFAHSFGSAPAQHSVKLTAVLSGDGLQGKWLDVDYITFTTAYNASSTSAIPIVTSSPPWLAGSSSTNAPSATPTPGATFKDTSSPSKTPTILAALFGAIIGLTILFLVAYVFLRRVYDRRRARERAFRYGQSSVNPSLVGTATATATVPYVPSSGGSVKSGDVGAREPSQRSAPLSPTQGGARDGSLSSNVVEMRSLSTEANREGAGTPTRPLLSASPITWTRQKVGKHKGDADSLRTDFLQV
ncbi:hypothetical protein PYCCODRAFT_1472280 [Trametes coccinea BRFM310]|uniref:Uncharacterized protein n=1 Tax=Trametes coccinea (strain BRFM310) TaxID=1353009 RepID=A0A1Y2I900_TRAC3|nr:hypothetical protein PYCCODRAFT_1472280 [Trametes coccinea BRFM310]